MERLRMKSVFVLGLWKIRKTLVRNKTKLKPSVPNFDKKSNKI